MSTTPPPLGSFATRRDTSDGQDQILGEADNTDALHTDTPPAWLATSPPLPGGSGPRAHRSTLADRLPHLPRLPGRRIPRSVLVLATVVLLAAAIVYYLFSSRPGATRDALENTPQMPAPTTANQVPSTSPPAAPAPSVIPGAAAGAFCTPTTTRQVSVVNTSQPTTTPVGVIAEFLFRLYTRQDAGAATALTSGKDVAFTGQDFRQWAAEAEDSAGWCATITPLSGDTDWNVRLQIAGADITNFDEGSVRLLQVRTTHKGDDEMITGLKDAVLILR